jgi:hypothetical protein
MSAASTSSSACNASDNAAGSEQWLPMFRRESSAEEVQNERMVARLPIAFTLRELRLEKEFLGNAVAFFAREYR